MKSKNTESNALHPSDDDVVTDEFVSKRYIYNNEGEKSMSIVYKLDLSHYSVEQLRKMYLTYVITKAEMNDELDDREVTRMVDRKLDNVG